MASALARALRAGPALAWRPRGGAPRRGFAWQAPSCDCYALLGVQRSASEADIKKAYLAKAKAAHPDSGANNSCNDAMVQLNLCYEALTRKRREYDMAKGVGGGPRASAYASSSSYASQRDAYWKTQGDEDFADFGMDWDEAFYGGSRRRGGFSSYSSGSATWKQRAESWRAESASSHDGRRQRPKAWDRARRHMYESSDNESEEDEGDPHEAWQGRGGKAKASGRRSREERAASSQRRETRKPPGELWIEVRAFGRGGKSSSEKISGSYQLMEERFNGKVAYAKVDEASSLFLFWSKAYGDWKLYNRLEDDGACLAVAEDAKGRRLPWFRTALRWKMWDPRARRFAPTRVSIEASGAPGSEGEGFAGAEGEGGFEGDVDEDDVPWSRPPWAKWTTSDLVRWAERRNIDLNDCFDRESILEKVIADAQSSDSDQGRKKHGARRQRSPPDADETSGSDSEDDARQRRGRGRSQSLGQVRLASRVKTDGSYTRPPVLDRRTSHYGNRIEAFRGDETDIPQWLNDSGDRSRLYAVYFDGDFGYSLVWKKGRYWGRPSYRYSRHAW